MSDRRLMPFSGRVAHETLRGQIEAPAFTAGAPARIGAMLVDLALDPGGPRERQWLHGAEVTVIDRCDGFAFAQAAQDGACGWVPETALAAPVPATHVVASRGTHLYREASIKRGEIGALSLGARVAVLEVVGALARTPDGFIPASHLRPLTDPEPDPVAVAERLIGTPYLWGGNSAAGIDCSGLVQLAFALAGLACPADSDQQRATFGAFLPEDAPTERGDLFFWAGHVAIALDDTTLLHANGHAMQVSREPIGACLARIASAEGGRYFGRKRPL